MTTIHKALEQALDTLEVAQRWHNGDKYRYGKPQQKEAWQAQRDELEAAITEGRKALAEQAPSTAGERAGPKANMFHDAGAIAQCHYCKRYTLDHKALQRDREPACTCGQRRGWSGSFKPPGPDAQWHGPAPAALLQPPALPDHIPDAGKMVAALPVGELTDEQIHKAIRDWCGDQRTGEDADEPSELEIARAILAAARSQPASEQASVSGWLPIESAPKDGTTIDLWHEEFGREADCYWGLPIHSCGEAGRLCDDEFHDLKPQWINTFNAPAFPEAEYSHWRLPPPPPLAAAPEVKP